LVTDDQLKMSSDCLVHGLRGEVAITAAPGNSEHSWGVFDLAQLERSAVQLL